ncbi:MAG: SUMF1/EgtB/PvdO family nonheme iron enzyme [Cytophagales bacterium]|nr:SUMF1/EgtB/PvdO family nonheme iron enzyme [Cytophagales bacterium]MDW8383638.1 SUMF1/EgtB/PvdO family nonheme iron enzyme [Flammeovirgaceae bacterium]
MKTNFLFIIAFFAYFIAYSNNIQVTNVGIINQNTTLDFSMIRFDISWQNSWRTSNLESNWDAAWVFVKYRRKWSNEWFHAYLHNTGHSAPSGCTLQPGLMNTSASFDSITNPAVGVFVYRSSDGIGNISFNNIQLRWNYGVNGLADYDSVEVCVYAIEMVYIPQGSFYVGDNDMLNNSTSSGRFRRGDADLPFQVTSEAALTINNTSATELWGTSTSGTNTIGGSGTLAASFPKGYGAFYIMKYELSQYMYKEFLNKLTRTQQSSRTFISVVGNYHCNSGGGCTSIQNRNGIRLISDPGGSLPRVFGNDLSGNLTPDESNDGQYIAHNWTSNDDLFAFADWSGLRPYTELEYEKVCRGTLVPLANERPWGNTNQTTATGITNPGQTNEIASPTSANIVLGNAPSVQGPLRSGNFARASSDREQAGAAYYGVLDMGGNLWELIVSVGVPTHRTFQGNIHGNGNLNAAGNSDVSGWAPSLCYRGGSWGNTLPTTIHHTSDRTFASSVNPNNIRYSSVSIRLARTSP